MKTTIKLDTSNDRPVRLSSYTVDATVKVTVNGYYWDVDGVYGIITGEFTPERVGVFGVDQFARENGLTVEELNQKVTRVFKQGLKV